MRQKTGIDIVHVPYRGGGATINDLLGGHIKVAFLSLSTAVPHLTTGKIKILAVVEKARYAAMPDVPTIGETVPDSKCRPGSGSSRRPPRPRL